MHLLSGRKHPGLASRVGRRDALRFGQTALLSTLVGTAVALVTSGCAAPTQRPSVAVPAARSDDEGRSLRLLPPFGLTTEADAVVRIVSDVTCTGTLIAEDLVLTAHHCVVARDAAGRPLRENKPAAELGIELGGGDLPWAEVGVRAVVAPACGYASGDGDLAILVLSRRLIGVPIVALRQGPPLPGETVFPMGFGRCAASRGVVHRVARAGGVVGVLRARQFDSSASICPGDSGGPACAMPNGDATCHEVVGVVSAAVMDGDDRTTGLAVYTRLDAWKSLFSAAREIADGADPSEVPPYGSCD